MSLSEPRATDPSAGGREVAGGGGGKDDRWEAETATGDVMECIFNLGTTGREGLGDTRPIMADLSSDTICFPSIWNRDSKRNWQCSHSLSETAEVGGVGAAITTGEAEGGGSSSHE